MSDFYDLIDQELGDADALTDIRLVVRRCWKYDFVGFPTYLWQGQGKLFTSDGNEWLGSVDSGGTDHHQTPAIQDGRDGSSGTYNMTMTLIDLPNQTAREQYEALKADQARAVGQTVTCYLALFQPGEALRPQTPIVYFKELIMQSVKFSEKIEANNDGVLVQKYAATVVCKDANFGRSSVPNGTYADTIQKQRARELGVPLDRGCEYLALLANRTYQIP